MIIARPLRRISCAFNRRLIHASSTKRQQQQQQLNSTDIILEGRLKTYYFLIQPTAGDKNTVAAIRRLFNAYPTAQLFTTDPTAAGYGTVRWMFRPISYVQVSADPQVPPATLANWGLHSGASGHHTIATATGTADKDKHPHKHQSLANETRQVVVFRCEREKLDYLMRELQLKAYYGHRPLVESQTDGWELKEDIYGTKEIVQFINDDPVNGPQALHLLKDLQAATDHVRAVYHNIHV